MRTKRDRRRTPQSTSLVLGKSIEDFWAEALPPDGRGDGDTASVKADSTISALPSALNGEGTSKVHQSAKADKCSKDTARIISKQIYKTKIDQLKERRKRAKNNYRIPVLNPDGTLAMPTTSRRANKWLKEKKAKIVKNKLGIFQVQLIKEPSGRNKQPIVVTVDPGSAFTGIGAISKNAVLYGTMLELPGYKKGSKPSIEKNIKASKDAFGKKIEKYPNAIVDGMTKRRELRRGRRYRKTRRRPERWVNRSRSKIPPSILARKQLELKIVTELSKIYPISQIGFEDIKFDHWGDKKGVKGQFFSHVEVGKNWLLDRLRNIAPKGDLRIIRGYETNIRRQQLGLKKEADKTVRDVSSHVNDCIAMGSILLGLGIETKNKFKFDIITRPKYSRRFLHLEQFGKGGVRRKYGGTTADWTNIRKGDYVETIQGKKVSRGWVSGFIDDKRVISVSDFDWKRLGQFGCYNVRLLDRNHGLLINSLSWSKDKKDICQFGTVQRSIEDVW